VLHLHGPIGRRKIRSRTLTFSTRISPAGEDIEAASTASKRLQSSLEETGNASGAITQLARSSGDTIQSPFDRRATGGVAGQSGGSFRVFESAETNAASNKRVFFSITRIKIRPEVSRARAIRSLPNKPAPLRGRYGQARGTPLYLRIRMKSIPFLSAHAHESAVSMRFRGPSARVYPYLQS